TITPGTATITPTPTPIAAIAAPTKAAPAKADPAKADPANGGLVAFSDGAGIAAIAAPTRAAPAKAKAGAGDPLELFMEAEDIVRSVTNYLAADGAEPAWLD